MIDPNSPAFPSAMILPKDYGVDGLTIRAYFAARAMQGMASNPSIIGANARCGWDYVNCTPDNVAQAALAQADAMIAELNKAPVGHSYEEQQEGPQ